MPAKNFVCIKEHTICNRILFAEGRSYIIVKSNRFAYQTVDDHENISNFNKEFLKEHFTEGN